MGRYRFSVVISTYLGESAANLNDSLSSIFSQTITPDEVVLVVDGEIGDDQKYIIKKFSLEYDTLSVVWLAVNVGRGRARNVGVEKASHEVVAIMDSDDVACSDRFAYTLDALDAMSVDLVCSFHEEFDNTTGNTLSIKRCPEFDREIKKAITLSCVVSNPTIVFKKLFWEKVGGFPEFKDCNEDYLFFMRLIKADCTFYCVQKPLLKVRVSDAQRQRRAGLTAFKSDFYFRKICVEEGHHSKFVAFLVLSVFFVKRFSPQCVRNLMNYLWRMRKFS